MIKLYCLVTSFSSIISSLFFLFSCFYELQWSHLFCTLLSRKHMQTHKLTFMYVYNVRLSKNAFSSLWESRSSGEAQCCWLYCLFACRCLFRGWLLRGRLDWIYLIVTRHLNTLLNPLLVQSGPSLDNLKRILKPPKVCVHCAFWSTP